MQEHSSEKATSRKCFLFYFILLDKEKNILSFCSIFVSFKIKVDSAIVP